ncbi:MAG: hypothetical protein RSC43_05760, partial [Clostridia bacterium]
MQKAEKDYHIKKSLKEVIIKTVSGKWRENIVRRIESPCAETFVLRSAYRFLFRSDSCKKPY